MLIGFKNNNALYHGTSSSRAEKILKHGFKLGDHNHGNRIASKAIFLVLNRPLISLRHAIKQSDDDEDNDKDAVVFNVTLKGIDDESFLDLTSDVGLHILFEGYAKLNRIFKQEEIIRNISVYDYDGKQYKASGLKYISELHSYGQKILKQCSLSRESICWDTAPLRLIAKENFYEVIVATIQDGALISDDFQFTVAKDSENSNYKGLRYLDHIEVCVLNESLIPKNSLKKECTKEIIYKFNRRLVT